MRSQQLKCWISVTQQDLRPNVLTEVLIPDVIHLNIVEHIYLLGARISHLESKLCTPLFVGCMHQPVFHNAASGFNPQYGS